VTRIRRRLERLEDSLAPDQVTNQHEDLEDLLTLLDDLPISERAPWTSPPTDTEVTELRRACRNIAERVRTGEMTSSAEIMQQLPDSALLELLAHFSEDG
jgi:hypothetical protein